MKSKISFYSFKDTDNNITARKFRKDKESFFDEFQVTPPNSENQDKAETQRGGQQKEGSLSERASQEWPVDAAPQLLAAPQDE